MNARPFFLATAAGQNFCLFDRPATPPRGAVLYIAPWCEEANKSRRLAALQTAAFVEAGYAVLRMDLFGCGDSLGAFEDATWETWLEDLQAAHDWLAKETAAPIWLWGIRSGCLLARDFAARTGLAPRLIFWQPPLSGKSFLQQFLRLDVAAQALDSNAETPMPAASARLAAGETIEIGGYPLSPALARALEEATLAPLEQSPDAYLLWLELSTRTEHSPASLNIIQQWQAAGIATRHATLNAPAFWQTYDISDAPELVARTTALLATEQVAAA